MARKALLIHIDHKQSIEEISEFYPVIERALLIAAKELGYFSEMQLIDALDRMKKADKYHGGG